MESAAQFLNYDVSPLELLLLLHDNYVQIKLRDFQPSSGFFPSFFALLSYIYTYKKGTTF
jgi:hypothetical protein